MRASRVATALSVLVAALLLTGSLQVVDAPSGKYKKVQSHELFDYNNVTGALKSTGIIDTSVCVGSAEDRLMIAGVCVDIDPTPNGGYDARAFVALVYEWNIQANLWVNGVPYPYCTNACWGDAVPGLTYFSFKITKEEVCKDFPGASSLQATVQVTARDNDAQLTVTATDGAVINCGYQA